MTNQDDFEKFEDHFYRGQRERAERLVPVKVPDGVWEFRPVGHRLLVIREEPLRKTTGGIIIPSTAQHDQAKGWVVLVGWDIGERVSPGGIPPLPYPADPTPLVGRKVTFGKYAGVSMTFEAFEDPTVSQFVLLTEWDILGFLVEETKDHGISKSSCREEGKGSVGDIRSRDGQSDSPQALSRQAARHDRGHATPRTSDVIALPGVCSSRGG
jgi:co-chaperonin GroES (HSP10)